MIDTWFWTISLQLICWLSRSLLICILYTYAACENLNVNRSKIWTPKSKKNTLGGMVRMILIGVANSIIVYFFFFFFTATAWLHGCVTSWGTPFQPLWICWQKVEIQPGSSVPCEQGENILTGSLWRKCPVLDKLLADQKSSDAWTSPFAFFIPWFCCVKLIYSLFNLFYVRYSSIRTKPGPGIYCPSVSNASRIPEDVNGLVNCDMQRYLLSAF